MSARNVLRRLVYALKNSEKIDLLSGEAVKFLPVADDTGQLQFGDGTNDMDVEVYLGDTTKKVTFDVGNSEVLLGTGVSLDVPAGGLQIANTAVDATAAELNRKADASARIVTSTATALSLTSTQHSERVLVVNTDSTVANTFTLPAATGTGDTYTIINNVVQTQGSVVVAAAGTNVIKGVAYGFGSTEEAAEAFFASPTSDKITFNITTTGGLGGDTVELIDIATGSWYARVFFNGSGEIATPFAAT